MTECCCSCGSELWIERLVNHELGGDSSTRIDFCMTCQTSAFHAVLESLIDRIADPQRREEIRRRWHKAGMNITIKDLADSLDN